LTIVEFAEEQEKDKYCIGARTKYEEAIRIREELLNDIEKEMKTLKENIEIKDSPRDGDEGYLSEDDKIDDDEEIIELDNGLLGTTEGRILVPESLKDKILKRFHDSPYAGRRISTVDIKLKCPSASRALITLTGKNIKSKSAGNLDITTNFSVRETFTNSFQPFNKFLENKRTVIGDLNGQKMTARAFTSLPIENSVATCTLAAHSPKTSEPL
jgi:hypothetical protein